MTHPLYAFRSVKSQRRGSTCALRLPIFGTKRMVPVQCACASTPLTSMAQLSNETFCSAS
jgi:hypothetical protein